MPVDVGDLWSNQNNTRNTIFRDLPSNWQSLRLKIAAFAPTRNYQQAGLVVYQDDDNYVQVSRIYENGNRVTFIREVGRSARNIKYVTVTATTNLYFRLDRDPGTNNITAYYSLDGVNWINLGSVSQSLSNP